MNRDRIQGNWKQAAGRVDDPRGGPTDDDGDITDRRRDRFPGKTRVGYDAAKDEAEKQLTAWQHSAGRTGFFGRKKQN